MGAKTTTVPAPGLGARRLRVQRAKRFVARRARPHPLDCLLAAGTRERRGSCMRPTKRLADRLGQHCLDEIERREAYFVGQADDGPEMNCIVALWDGKTRLS